MINNDAHKLVIFNTCIHDHIMLIPRYYRIEVKLKTSVNNKDIIQIYLGYNLGYWSMLSHLSKASFVLTMHLIVLTWWYINYSFHFHGFFLILGWYMNIVLTTVWYQIYHHINFFEVNLSPHFSMGCKSVYS